MCVFRERYQFECVLFIRYTFFYLPEVFTALIQGMKIDAVAYLGLLAQVCKVNPKAAASPLTAFSVGIRDFRLTLSDQ